MPLTLLILYTMAGNKRVVRFDDDAFSLSLMEQMSGVLSKAELSNVFRVTDDTQRRELADWLLEV